MKCWKYILMLCGCCVLCSCSKPTQEAKFYDYNVIAHAGGGIDGNIYTDSLEALNQSYQNGTRLFDIDLRFTSDDEIVLRHDWTEVDWDSQSLGTYIILSVSAVNIFKNRYQENICQL